MATLGLAVRPVAADPRSRLARSAPAAHPPRGWSRAPADHLTAAAARAGPAPTPDAPTAQGPRPAAGCASRRLTSKLSCTLTASSSSAARKNSRLAGTATPQPPGQGNQDLREDRQDEHDDGHQQPECRELLAGSPAQQLDDEDGHCERRDDLGRNRSCVRPGARRRPAGQRRAEGKPPGRGRARTSSDPGSGCHPAAAACLPAPAGSSGPPELRSPATRRCRRGTPRDSAGRRGRWRGPAARKPEVVSVRRVRATRESVLDSTTMAHFRGPRTW